MDMHAAYQEVGSYRAAAEICGTTDKTIKRAVEKARAAETTSAVDVVVAHNYDPARARPRLTAGPRGPTDGTPLGPVRPPRLLHIG